MIRSITVFIFTLFILTNISSAQNYELKLKDNNSALAKPHLSKPLYKKSDLPTPLFIIGIAALISPMVVFEDKKVFFALTKEISIGKYPFGRISFEYSYVFRSYNTSHHRFSYNYDFMAETGYLIAFVATTGAGYFTDTKNKGWFLQGSVGAIMGPGEIILLNPYLKYRHTFIKDKSKTDINDISLGMAFILYF